MNNMKTKNSETHFDSPKQLSVEEQLSDLRIKLRNLERKVEQLQIHSHGVDGYPTVKIVNLHLP